MSNFKELKAKFASQKNGAKSRGIEWQLTFQEWLDWWGDDIARRGSGHDCLQMQRYGDQGPYAIGNIKKGHPRDNTSTWVRVQKNKKSNKAKLEHEQWLDALMNLPSKEEPDPEPEQVCGLSH